MISLEDSVVVDESVVFREYDGETVILNLQTGQYFALDEVGTRIWTLIRERQVLGTMLGALEMEYDASRERLKADLLQLVDQLTADGLVTVQRADTHR